jgi:hypothetical protein
MTLKPDIPLRKASASQRRRIWIDKAKYSFFIGKTSYALMAMGQAASQRKMGKCQVLMKGWFECAE